MKVHEIVEDMSQWSVYTCIHTCKCKQCRVTIYYVMKDSYASGIFFLSSLKSTSDHMKVLNEPGN